MKKERQGRQGKDTGRDGDRREQYHTPSPGQGSKTERQRRDERRKYGITTEQNRDQPPPRGRKTEGKKEERGKKARREQTRTEQTRTKERTRTQREKKRNGQKESRSVRWFAKVLIV